MNRIKQLRNEKGLSQVDLGNVFNISQQTISSYENGSREPDSELLKGLSKYFNVSIDFILGNSDIKEPAEKILEKNNDNEYTIALHNSDGYDADLPPEAREELKEYIEFLKHKYSKKE